MVHTLNHKVFNNSVKGSPFVTLRNPILFAFSSAKLPEILHSFRANISKKLEEDSPQRSRTNCDIEENNLQYFCTFLTCQLTLLYHILRSYLTVNYNDECHIIPLDLHHASTQ